ncbi:SDR family NAD(P)-dependent oxidoreductase [Pelagerythrobacter sp.]|uniref:SDR family NAD(P)-dependent oxidoreductase n=1 Tax=Pelagerythrobacter sp. TaxID=2800702 RepID=UPI0035B20CC8
MYSSRNQERIIVTGASGALGGALARLLARPGVELSLWGRDAARLDVVAGQVRAAGAEASTRRLDLTDGPGAVDAVLADDAAAPFAQSYLVAGLGDVRAPGDVVEDPALVLRLAQVNFAAPAAMAAALAGRMAARGHGRIILIGSAAGHHALPFAAAYSGSKAGLARFADALRIAVKPHGVTVTLAAPGFLDAPGGRGTPGGQRLLLSSEEAARRIVRAARAGKAHYVTPWPFAALHLVDALLPRALRDRVLAALPLPDAEGG